MNNREKIIKFLNKEQKRKKINPILIDKSDTQELKMSEEEIRSTLHTLADENFIRIEHKPIHEDFDRFWKIFIKEECIEYFDKKKTKKIENRRDWIRTYVPITLSIASIIISIIALIIAA